MSAQIIKKVKKWLEARELYRCPFAQMNVLMRSKSCWTVFPELQRGAIKCTSSRCPCAVYGDDVVIERAKAFILAKEK